MTWQRAFPRAVVTAFLCGLCLHVGKCSGERSAESHYEGVIAKIDTMHASEYAKLAVKMDKESDANRSLREKLEGIKQLTPRQRTVYDTVLSQILVPVAERVVIGNGHIETLVLQPDSGGFVPVRERFNYGNCDERLEFVRGSVVCNPARLGHLTAFVRTGPTINNRHELRAVAEAGVHWTPFYRSTTAIEITANGNGRAALTARLGLRIF